MKIPKKYEDLPRGDFRDAAFRAIEEIFKSDVSAIVLTNDMGAAGLDKLTLFAPDRVLNVGITEQNMMSVASGLAISGHIIFVYGIVSHIIFRAFEQIKLDICVQNLPIILIGVGAGLAYGVDGPTHHGTEDIAALRALPNIRIYNPCDYYSAYECVKEAYEIRTPAFIRLDKEYLPNIQTSDTSKGKGFRLIGSPGEGLIIGTGITVWPALIAQERLIDQSIYVQVLDLSLLKPLDDKEIRKICEVFQWVVVIEENCSCGGIHEAISRALIGLKFKFFNSINLGHNYLLGSAKREWVWSKVGMEGSEVSQAITRARES
jgi:transketolase